MLGRQTRGTVVVGCILFNNCIFISNLVSSRYCVSFEINYLGEFLINSCLYELNLGGTEVLLVDLNKKFLLLSLATIGTVPHHHSVHTYLLPPILLSILELSLCLGA